MSKKTTKSAKPAIRITKATLLAQLKERDRLISKLQGEVMTEAMYAERVEIALEIVSSAFAVSSAFVHNHLAKKMLADKLANMLSIAISQPSVANWVLKPLTFVADGISFTVTPVQGTQNLSKTAQLNLDGKERSSTSTFTGKAVISYRLPVIGRVVTEADVIHIESATSKMNTTVINNRLTFWIDVEGAKRLFTLEASGDLYKGEWFTFTVSNETFAGIDRTLCDLGGGCKEVHPPEENGNRPVGFEVSIVMNK